MNSDEIFASLSKMEPKILDELIKAAQKEKELRRTLRFNELTDQLEKILNQIFHEFPSVDWYFSYEEGESEINLTDFCPKDIVERLVP